MKKKLFILLLAVALIVNHIPLGMISVSASNTLVSGGYEYEIRDGEAVITGYEGSAKNVTIPSTLSGCPVTVIESYAFAYNDSIQSVVIPEGVTAINKKAFFACGKLKSVEFPSTLVEIGEEAFRDCESLEAVNFPYLGVQKISAYAFYCCYSLRA